MASVRRWIHQLDSRFLQRKTTLKQTEEQIEIDFHVGLSSVFLVPISILAWYFTDIFIIKLACVAFFLNSIVRYGLTRRLLFHKVSKEIEISQIFFNKYVWSYRHFQYHDSIELIVRQEYDSDSSQTSYHLYILDTERDRFLITMSSLVPFLDLKELLQQNEVIFHNHRIELVINTSFN